MCVRAHSRDVTGRPSLAHEPLQDHKLRLFSRDSNRAVVVAVREALEVCVTDCIVTLSCSCFSS